MATITPSDEEQLIRDRILLAMLVHRLGGEVIVTDADIRELSGRTPPLKTNIEYDPDRAYYWITQNG